MRVKDIGLLILICFFWGANAPISRWCLGYVPPLAFAFFRFLIISIILAPRLFPLPFQPILIFLIAMGMGGINFMFMFLGLKYSTASNVALIGQLSLPIVTLLSIIFLGERVKWRRTLGMVLAFCGVMLIVYKPEGFKIDIGIIYALLSTILGAIGTILMKKLTPISAFQLQAWVAFYSLLPLGLASFMVENNQISSIIHAPIGVFLALAFSSIGVSIIGHTSFYSLVKKYDVTLLMPFTLMVPLWAVLIAVVFLGEKMTPQLVVGGLICLSGVGMIALRENKAFSKNNLEMAKGNIE